MKYYITPKLETDRLILQRGSKEDYIKVYEYDYNILRLANAGAKVKNFKLSPSAINSIYLPRKYLNSMFDWIIYTKGNKKAVGHIIAFNINKENSSIRLLYNLHPDYWHDGYMTEALLEVMYYLFSKGFDNVFCGYKECHNIRFRELNDEIELENFKDGDNCQARNDDLYDFTSSIFKKIRK